jgi:hypothetical protein
MRRAKKPPADGQGADLALQRAPRYVDGALGGEQGLARFGKKKLALRCKPGASLGTIKERPPDLTLQIGDLFADGRLRDVKVPARFTEGA